MVTTANDVLSEALRPDRGWNWKTRSCAWIFGLQAEHLLAPDADQIVDGEGYSVWQVWAPGVNVPKGEAERANRMKMEAYEFHRTMEQTMEDLVRALRVSPYATSPAHGFWIEPTGTAGDDSWRCLYACAPGTPVKDVLAIAGRMARPGRAKFMASVKSYRLKYLRDDVGI